MMTQHNRKTARLSPDYTFAIRELGVWSGDETNIENVLFQFTYTTADTGTQVPLSLQLYSEMG